MRTLARVTRMGPDEIRTRARQALFKRLDLLHYHLRKPLACGFTATSASPAFLEPPANPSPDLLPRAQKICLRRFDLLGFEDLDFGAEIDWHFDPVHQKRAPRIPWYRIPFLDFDQVGDHKIIWELNRHQHLYTLAEAWWFTRDDIFAAEVLSQWRHWERENPYPIGINWASALEVAFRALSLLAARDLLANCPSVPDSFHHDMLSALHLHGWYIERYLSTYFAPNTHLLGEGVALFALGLLCPQFACASRWQARGWQIILRQSEAQVLPDGFHFEQSVYYHVYALDFFLYARSLAARNKVPVPEAFDRILEKMANALSAISQAGHPPAFGDDDGGRVIPAREHRPPSPPRFSVALKSCGMYAMTSRDSQLFIDAGPHGVFSGGHSHADALSVQLITNGRPVLIDPGTFCYVCPDRDRFRGTAAHNTLQVDGRDQARPVQPFAWTGVPQTTLDRWITTERFDFLAAHHDGYAPVVHHRWVFGLKDKFWLIRDVAAGAGRHRLDLHWHFIDEDAIAVLSPAGHGWSRFIESFPWSPVYGKREPAFALRFSIETTLPAEFAVLLLPRAQGVFRQMRAGSYHYEDSHGAHTFIFDGPRFIYRSQTAAGVEEISV
jgi:hypothetical protein